MKYLIIFLIGIFLFLSVSAPSTYATALTTGEVYTITLEAIQSNGTVTSVGNGNSLNKTTQATADLNGKISFSFSFIPTNTSYNFLVVTIKDSLGTTVRRSIIPAPVAGGTIDLGVSPMTEAQTRAMLQALQTAGTDDPIMVLFGSIIIRSGGFTSEGDNNDIDHLANIGIRAIKGSNGDDTENGFNWYLKENITDDQFNTFKSSIVSNLGSYTSNLKEAVEATDDTTAKDERAEAAGLLSYILIEAADDAAFDVGYINAAMKAASDQVEEYLLGAGSEMDESAVSAMDTVMASNYMKLNAERLRLKYKNALVRLEASDEQTTRFETALATLTTSMVAAFKVMEEVFETEDALGDKADIDAKFIEAQSDINTAFDQFMIDIASTNEEIDAMVSAMASGFLIDEETLTDMKDPNIDEDYSDGMFTFRNMSGTAFNWPITMVVQVTWVANTYGNNFTYTRDTNDVPTAMEWLDADDDGNWEDDSYQKRHDFDNQNQNEVEGDEKGMPAGLAAIFGLREDMEILLAARWAAMAAAAADMTQDAFDNLSGDDLTEATNDRDVGEDVDDDEVSDIFLSIIAAEDSALDDWEAGTDFPAFRMLNDLSPYLTGGECQGIEDLFKGKVDIIKDCITVTEDEITDEKKQALIDTATMPDFN
ncbi:MAG: hypothetical protein ABIG92_05890 [Candidatus Omnitrophota bacterium]